MNLRRFLRSASGKRFTTPTVGKVVAALLQALFFAALAQSMGLKNFGIFSIGYSLTLFVMAIFEFGFGSVSLRVGKETAPKSVISTMLVIRLISNAIVILTMIAFWGLILQTGVAITIAVVLFAMGEAWANLLQNILVGRLRERLSVSVLIARRLISLALAGVALIGLVEIDPFVVVTTVGVLNLVLPVLALLPHLGKPQNALRLVQARWRYGLTSSADNAKQLDVVLVGAVAGDDVAGLFSAATKLVAPFRLLTSSLIQTLVPELIERQKKGAASRHLVSRAANVMTGFAAGLLAASALSPWLLATLYGEEFRSAWPIAIAAFFVVGLAGINQCLFAWEYSIGVRTNFAVAMAVLNGLYLITVTVTALVGAWAIAVGMIASALVSHIYYRIGFARSTEEESR